MSEQKTLILIDGHALAFRQYYALERTNMKTKDGTPTWAVYGFFKAIFDLLKNNNLSPDAIGVAFDVSHHTFRTDEYSEYKANREAMPDPMRIQMELIYEGLRAFNIPIYTKEGFEADDVIGTISKRAADLGHKVFILTGDQDSFQLIRTDGSIKVIIPSKGELIEYDWNRVYDKLGVYPNQIIDYKALRGDTSDNIPGIKGIGEKTAVKLLAEFGTVDNVLANIDSVEGKALKEKLKNGTEDAKMSKYLATIVQDVDVPFDFDKTEINMPDISSVTEFLRSMQFYSFLKNIEYILKLFNKDVVLPQSAEPQQKQEIQGSLFSQPAENDNGQLGLFAQAVQSEVNKEKFDYNSHLITDSIDLDNMVSKLSEKSLIALNMFVQLENAIDVKTYGIAIGYNDFYSYGDNGIILNDVQNVAEVYYIPLLHNIDKQLDKSYVISKLTQLFENKNIKFCVHDVKKHICALHSLGADNFNGVVFDTMLASYIYNSNANSSFDIQCMEQINHILPTVVSDTKKTSVADNDITVMTDYAGDVIASLFRLASFWAENLDKSELKILSDIEIPLAYVLADMETAGVSVDVKYLNELSAEFDAKLQSLEGRIYELAGEPFNLNSPKQVSHILFDKLQLKSSKRGKSKNSTSAEVLNALAEEFEIPALILEYRKYAKLKSTYTEALPALINSKDGRIHAFFNQTVATTGRLSSSNPNLQNIPIRTEEGNKIRQAFVPKDRDNALILSADYSQIELRLLAHVSGDVNLINAFNSGIDVHTLTASKVFDVPVDEVTKEMRYKAKAVNFGIVYGQSKYGLAKSLKISADEAQSFIDKYFMTYPRIQSYMNEMVEFVEQNGYVSSIFGRRRNLESEINSPNGMIREFAKRAAINHPMQGSAADLIKIAMIDFEKALKENKLRSQLIMQVHDELVVEVYKDELEKVKELVLSSMELNQPLKVKLLVDVNVGESWKES